MARKPLFSGNYGSALARVDTAPIVGAGRAQGQTFQQIGGMIQQYGLNKEKQKKNQAFIKGQSNLLDMLSEQDPEQADRYAMMKEQLNNPDVSLTERAELGKQLVQNVTLSNQMQNQMLNRKTQEQALGLAKKLEESQVTIAKLQAEIAGKTKDSVISGADAVARAKTSQANMSEVNEAYQKTDNALDRENKQSLINYRNAATFGMVLKQNNINAPVPQDLEKRFSDIATQLGKNDDSKVKVRTSGILGGDEVEITYSDYKENPNEYAPLVNNEIKALQANEERLIKERTNVIQGFKIPVIDKETGEQIFITLLQKMEYDEKRKQLQNQEDSKRSLDQRSGYMSGMNMDYSNLDPSVAELMAGSGQAEEPSRLQSAQARRDSNSDQPQPNMIVSSLSKLIDGQFDPGKINIVGRASPLGNAYRFQYRDGADYMNGRVLPDGTITDLKRGMIDKYGDFVDVKKIR